MSEPDAKQSDIFVSTQWSVVLRAGGAKDQAQSALDKLCQTYWYPLYGFVRRRGFDEHQAQDMTQEFFAQLVTGTSLQSAHPEKGKFRAFLLSSMKNLLANEWRDSRRIKRGGGAAMLSWEELNAEGRYELEPADSLNADAWFDRRWAQALVERALSRLGREMEEQGLKARYDILKRFLQGDGGGQSYADAAKAIGLSEGATKTAIFRLRKRYGELIREEIAQTVSSPEEVEEEIQALIGLLSG